jgi:hypothetical protein
MISSNYSANGSNCLYTTTSPMILDTLTTQSIQDSPAPADDSDKKSDLYDTSIKVEALAEQHQVLSSSTQSCSSPVNEQSMRHKKRKERDECKSVESNKISKTSPDQTIAKIGRLEKPEDDMFKFALVPEDVKKVICSQVKDWEDLLSWRGCSKEYRDFANYLLVDMINAKTLSLDDLNIVNVNKLIEFFGDQCKYILCLDLKGFTINDTDIANIPKKFPELKHLSIDHGTRSDITNESIQHLAKLTALESFKYTGNYTKGRVIDFSFLKDLKFFKSLEFHNNAKIKSFKFLAQCKQLNKLIIKDFHSNYSAAVKNFNGHVLQNLDQLTTLHLEKGPFIIDTDSIKKLPLKHLGISTDMINTNFNFLTNYKELESLAITREISGYIPPNWSILNQMDLYKLKSLSIPCMSSEDCKYLEKALNLTSLHIVNPQQNFNFECLEQLQSLTELHIKNESFDDLNLMTLQHLKKLTNINIKSLFKSLDFSIFKDFEHLRSLTIHARDFEIQNAGSLPPNLTTLSIFRFTNKDISFIKSLNNLEQLVLHTTDCVEYSPLQHLHKLRALDLSVLRDDKTTRLNTTVLQKLSSLKELAINCSIENGNLTPLIHIKNLHKLDINYYINFTKFNHQSSFKNLIGKKMPTNGGHLFIPDKKA